MPRTPPTLSSSRDESGALIVALSGDLDTYGTRQIKTAFARALGDRTKDTVLELSSVNFVTSAALAMFVSHAQAAARAGGSVTLAAPTPVVREVLHRAGFPSLLRITDSVEDAIRALNAPQPPPAEENPVPPDDDQPDTGAPNNTNG